jgi:hypothetical protein
MVGNGIWRKKLKNVKNVHCRTWHMARKLKKHGNTHTHTHTAGPGI